ncbi:hypothetical protein ACN4EG_24690 [Alkalinema pantanalense CENA528]|uniref:hypothetical protein n=1 Tax=Alkalinema pantanalense TaxID=1620705 RepID=UPI003D6EEA95
MNATSRIIFLVKGWQLGWIIPIVFGMGLLTGGCTILESEQSPPDPKPQATALAAQPQKTKTPAKVSAKIPATTLPLSPAQTKAIAFNNQGVGKIAKFNYKGAIQDLNQAIKWNSKFSEAYLNRGIAYSSLGNSTAALKDFNLAIKLNGSLALAYMNRADEYVNLGQKTKAIGDLRKASTLLTQQGDSANAEVARTSLQSLENPTLSPSPASSVSAAPSAATATAPQSAEMALAQHLNTINAKMYGTYWCSVCNWQKELFREARYQFNYIECDPRGTTPQSDRCDAAEIEAYPTWEINGEYRRGGISLEELADLSGYQGPRNFNE